LTQGDREEKELTAAANLVKSATGGNIMAEQPFTEALRQAIAESGMAHIAIERATGVKRQCVMAFMRGTRSLRLDIADRLAAFFAIEALIKRKRKGG
jgi:hypothetical protein